MKQVPVQNEPGAWRLCPAAPVAPHLADFGAGPTRVFPANQMVCGTIDTPAGEVIIVTLVGVHPLAGPVALTDTLTVEGARAVAAALVESADRIEQAASDQAVAAFRKAAGK